LKKADNNRKANKIDDLLSKIDNFINIISLPNILERAMFMITKIIAAKELKNIIFLSN
jgi:hypothetical protein